MSWKPFYICKSPPKTHSSGSKPSKSFPKSPGRKSKPAAFDQMTVMSDDGTFVSPPCGSHRGHYHGHSSLALNRWDYPSPYVTKQQWSQYQEMMSSTLNRAKQEAELIEGLKSSIDDMKDSQAKRQDDCMLEVQKVRDHLEEQEKKREEAQRLDNIRKEAYERGKRDERERAATCRQNAMIPNDDIAIAELRGFRMGCERKQEREREWEMERLRQQEAESLNREEWTRMEQFATLIGDHIIDRATIARRGPLGTVLQRPAYRHQQLQERSVGLIDDHPWVRPDELSDFLSARPPHRGGYRR